MKKLTLTIPFDQDLDLTLKREFSNYFKDHQNYIIKSKSLDARRANTGRIPKFIYELVFFNDLSEISDLSITDALIPQSVKSEMKPPIIVGSGPAGLFAALQFVEAGIPFVLCERGDAVKERMKKISTFWRYGKLDEESNVCYGEGGAGLYSDGKLITRIKSPLIPYVMKKLVQFGAPKNTEYLSNPHLGSNKIRTVLEEMTKYLKNSKGKILYNARVEEILFSDKKVTGVKLASGEVLESGHVILATGHSAKKMYYHLEEHGVAMKAKDFAVGLRIEHKRSMIDRMQHGDFATSPILGAARYRLSYHNKRTDRGTYSFCMCPGGNVLSSGTDSNGLVTNGMSNSGCNSPWSNAGLVVSVKSGVDFDPIKEDVLAGVKFLDRIEQGAFELSKKYATGKELPAMTVAEFINGKCNSDPLPKSSSPSHLFKVDFFSLFPKFVIDHLKDSLEMFEEQIPGFAQNGILIAPETRTSSPVTILRDPQTFESTSHKGLYPAGEGAGHAGGITSAAVDGVRIAREIIKIL